MDASALSELDYFRIRDEAAACCVSEEGKKSFCQRLPLTDEAEIEALKNISRDWSAYNSSSFGIALFSWPPVAPLFSRISVPGASLSVEEFHALSLFCASVKKLSSSIEGAEKELSIETLSEAVRRLPDLTKPASEIARVVASDGELKDLPELREIKTKIANLNKKIQSIMRSYTGNQKLSSALESTVPALRSGHQVLAVKASHRSRIAGIVHEVSQSGQTVYIEPEESVRTGNELLEEEANLQIAVKAILKKLTASLAPYVPLFEAALPSMIAIDEAYARAKWGVEYRAAYALPCGKKDALTLLGARHPLLGEKAVPIDVRFMSGKKVLIMTGPNTGGKTVTLKTIALFSLLNQSGFPIPAAEGSRLPIFDTVFADIGDGQSIDSSLSTFGSHMKNIARAIAECGENSLVLLDELGSGTDPQEGAAIGMAVLDALIEKKAFTLVTTHQGVLKNYGWTHESCINASAEFDGETLAPTYRILMGVPGESRALDIAQKSGLPPSVVEKAREYIAGNTADISALIAGLTAKHAEADALVQDCRRKEAELAERQYVLDAKELENRQKEQELQEAAHEKAEVFLSESRKRLENLVRVIREGEITREKTLAVKRYIDELTEAVASQKKALDEKGEKLSDAQNAFKNITPMPHPKSAKPTKRRVKNAEALRALRSADNANETKSKASSFEPGTAVIAGEKRMSGTILSRTGKERFLVQFGSIKIEMKQKDLTPAASLSLSSAPLVTVETKREDAGEHPAFELRLLGLREAEAIAALERQLDLCTIHDFKRFSVIHGKGNGVLQQAVQNYLSHCAGVKAFRFAPPEDGGAGKTYVELH